MISAGDTFGRWSVVSIPDPRRPSRIEVRCSCGTEKIVTAHSLERGLSTGCRGCAKLGPGAGAGKRHSIESGHRFGAWTVIHEIPPGERRGLGRSFLVRCDCGAEHAHQLGNLMHGGTSQCRACSARAREQSHLITHGLSSNPLYQVHRGILERCTNAACPSYSRYGGRGITVCAEWRTGAEGIAAFIAYVESVLGPRPTDGHSLDRIDNDRGYEPGNLRWATQAEQMRNTRRSRRLRLGDRILTLQEVGDLVGVSREGIRIRLAAGWTVEECATHRRGAVPARLVAERAALSAARLAARRATRRARYLSRQRVPRVERAVRSVRPHPMVVVRGDGKRAYQCSCCGEHGHNARTCERRASTEAA